MLSRRESGGRLLAAGVVGVIGAFASGQAVRIVIRRHSDGSTASEETDVEYASGLEPTRPTTPTLLAASSLSSSVTSLELLTRATASPALAEDMMASTKTPSDEDVISLDKEVFDEADVVEVGRGLANYNSAQISRVKGLNR